MAGERHNKQLSGGCGVLFGLIILAAGLIAVYFLLAVPNYRWYRAQSWVETPCVIVSSEVGAHSGKNGSTYSIDIRFQYEFGGREYQSDRYNFDTGSSSGRAGKENVVSQFPPGSNAICYVDPADPSWAVLNRNWSWMYAIGGFFLIVVVVGLALIFGSLRSPKVARAVSPLGTTIAVETLPSDAAARVLESTISPRQTLVSSLVFVILWYLILGAVGWGFLHEGLGWDNAIPAGIIAIMLLAGLFGVAGVVKGFLGLWNPRVRLRMDPGVLRLGGQVAFSWELDGDVARLQSLKIYLQGKESATYRRGTDTSTDHSIFDKIIVAEATTVTDMRAGQVQFAMPEFTMHTLDLPNNKVSWVVRVEGSIAKWPDVEEEFPVMVLPLPLPSGAPAPAEAFHD